MSPDNVANSKNCDTIEIQSLKIANKSKSFYMFLINACSLLEISSKMH